MVCVCLFLELMGGWALYLLVTGLKHMVQVYRALLPTGTNLKGLHKKSASNIHSSSECQHSPPPPTHTYKKEKPTTTTNNLTCPTVQHDKWQAFLQNAIISPPPHAHESSAWQILQNVNTHSPSTCPTDQAALYISDSQSTSDHRPLY